MKQKVLKPLYNTIHYDLDGLNLAQAITKLVQYQAEYYKGKEVVISWERAEYSDSYELALYERRDETDVEEAVRLLREEKQGQQQLECKRRQLAALKKELGEE